MRVDGISRPCQGENSPERLGYRVGEVDDLGSPQKKRDRNLCTGATPPDLRNDARRRHQRRPCLGKASCQVRHHAAPSFERDECSGVEDHACRMAHAALLRRDGFVSRLNMALALRISSRRGQTLR